MQLSQTFPKPLDPLRLLWVHRFLIRQLVERELTVKFKRSRGGLLWLVLQPLLLLAGYTLVFGVILKSRWGSTDTGSSAEFALIMKAGQRFVWEIVAHLPLSRGYYSLHGGIKPTPDSPYFYDRCFSMAVLEIMGNPLSWGDYGGRVIHAATELTLYTLD